MLEAKAAQPMVVTLAKAPAVATSIHSAQGTSSAHLTGCCSHHAGTSQLIAVTIPPGYSSGQPLVVQASDGQKLQVVIPVGMSEGQQFSMCIPYRVGDAVYYTGASETFQNGDGVVYGEQGEVIAATSTVPDKRVRVQFPNNADWVDCLLTELCRTKPPDEVRIDSFATSTSVATHYTCMCPLIPRVLAYVVWRQLPRGRCGRFRGHG